MLKQLKEARQVVAWSANEMHRRKSRRKASLKEKKIIRRLEDRAEQKMLRNEDLLQLREKSLRDLRYYKVKIDKLKVRDARIQNNRMFSEDQAGLYRKTSKVKRMTGNMPNIEKFEEF